MLVIPQAILDEIYDDGEKSYPHECCGAMFGSIDGDRKTLSEITPIFNNSSENKKRRFEISNMDYMKAERYASQQGLSLLGFYHSHPDHPPIPSETDKRFAWPVFSYIIFSVKSGKACDLHSYLFDVDEQTFHDEATKIEKGA